jgi:molybdopterin synthase sulfur carrier subunit
MNPPVAPTVQVVYLARLRECFGTAGERVALPEGVGTVAEFRRWLALRGGVWATELAPERAVRFALNHDVVGPQAPVAPGDEVALFPPVTGG